MNPFDAWNAQDDLVDINDWMAQQRFANSRPAAVQPQQPKKKKNFWVDQISTAGGILGGIGGSFIAPIAGTAGGAAIGSALGETLENALTGESLGKNVVKEGVLGGAFGAGPIKLAKAGVGVLKGGAKSAGSEATTRTAAQRGAQKLLGDAWGIKTGAKVGSNTLTPQDAQRMQKFITNEVKVPRTANADIVAERLENFRKVSGQNIDNIVTSNNRPLAPEELQQVSTAVGKRIGELAGVDATNPTAARMLTQLNERNDLAGLVQFRRSLDDTINFSRNPQSPDPVTERLATAMREEIDKATSKLIPGLKAANIQYSQATRALDYVLPSARSPKGINVFGNTIGGGLAQRSKAALGQTVGRGKEVTPPVVEDAMTGSRSAPGVKSALGITGRLGAYGTLAGGEAQPPNSLEDAMLQQDGVQLPVQFPSAGLPQPSETQQSPYSRENLMADVQRDPANAEDYFGLYQMYQEAFAPPAGEKPLSAEASKIVSNANIGLQALQDYSSAIENDPSVLLKRTIPGRGLMGGALGGALGTRGADAAASQIVDTIARLRSGAAITNDEAKRFEQFIPQFGDSDEVKNQKISYLMNQFQMVANRSGSAGTDLESAILSGQYQ